jgi:hypothetical protein
MSVACSSMRQCGFLSCVLPEKIVPTRLPPVKRGAQQSRAVYFDLLHTHVRFIHTLLKQRMRTVSQLSHQRLGLTLSPPSLYTFSQANMFRDEARVTPDQANSFYHSSVSLQRAGEGRSFFGGQKRTGTCQVARSPCPTWENAPPLFLNGRSQGEMVPMREGIRRREWKEQEQERKQR